MVAFAANSLLCRLALGSTLIDAASFASVRIISGAAILGVILAIGVGISFFSGGSDSARDNSTTALSNSITFLVAICRPSHYDYRDDQDTSKRIYCLKYNHLFTHLESFAKAL